jgi:hypothetical protein
MKSDTWSRVFILTMQCWNGLVKMKLRFACDYWFYNFNLRRMLLHNDGGYRVWVKFSYFPRKLTTELSCQVTDKVFLRQVGSWVNYAEPVKF